MYDIPISVDNNSPKLVDKLRIFMRARNMAYATERTYVFWVIKFILFHNKRHPMEMGTSEIEQYLNFIAFNKQCSQSTQRVVLNALIFLYSKFLRREDIGRLDFKVASKAKKIPIVLSKSEVAQVISCLSGKYKLMLQIVYGSGLRISVVVN